MATDNNPLHRPSPESLRAGYELSTVSVRGLIYFVLGLLISAVIIHAGVWFLLMGLYNVRVGGVPPASALTDEKVLSRAMGPHPAATLPGPPPPQLQPSAPDNHVPEADLQQMMEGQDVVFRQMGWVVDPQTHAPLHISESALEQVIREEQQWRSRPPPAPATQTSQPSQPPKE